MPQRYICSFPQEETAALASPADRGKRRHLYYPDGEAGRQQAEQFAQHENKPGRAVYDCIGILADDATSRCKETIVELDKVVADVDLKNVVETREQILSILQGMLLPPSTIHDSGYGFWPEWHFKERLSGEAYLERCEIVMRRLADRLAADPAPAHRAALKRRPGTDNYKSAEPRRCHAVYETSKQYDLSEIEDMLDLYGERPLLTRKEGPRSNGHDHAGAAGGAAAERVDIAAGLDAMHYKGLGTAALHASQLKLSAAMLRNGESVEVVVAELLARTRGNNADDPRISTWEWGNVRHSGNGDPGEEWRIREMCYSFINKHPELAYLLDSERYATWRVKEVAGAEHIQVKWSGLQGGIWCVAGYKQNTDNASDPPPGSTEDRVENVVKFRQPVVYSSGEFTKNFTPPDYLVDGVLQRRFIYALTGKTGDGKTAVVLLLAYCVAEGRMFGNQACERGTVFILVGENPDDVRMRWIGLAAALKFDVDNIDVHFIPGVFPIERIRAEIGRVAKDKNKTVNLLIVDTSAAYFSGQDENSNVQLGNHARELRNAFIGLPGQPCVLVTNHPTKSPDMENLLPRGGGAYLAEVDGNLVAIRNEATTTVHWHGKFRGPDFDPIIFELVEVTAPTLVDSKNRQIPTIIARALDDTDHAKLKAKARADNDTVLVILLAAGDGADKSLLEIAVSAGWVDKKGEPNKSRARKTMDRLRKDKLVRLEQEIWQLTDRGEKAALRAKERRRHAG